MFTRTASSLTVLQTRSLGHWLAGLTREHPASSNQPSLSLPFQRWFKFKEAFAPNLVIDCLRSLSYQPRSCLDAFGGCGTTALTSQFLGIVPTLIEVNPFIADLAEAKLCAYDQGALQASFSEIRRTARAAQVDEPWQFLGEAPTTFCERPKADRWLFTRATLGRIIAYRQSIEALGDPASRRLLRVLLGACLVPLSNVVVNGKGRRYRQGWEVRQSTPADVDELLEKAFHMAMSDVRVYNHRATTQYHLHRGSALSLVTEIGSVDCAIFSPPYPNSFDYTDIYNIELWVLGYLKTRAQDRSLRLSTVRSHVQVELENRGTPADSVTLTRLMRKLKRARDTLWDPRIPEMVAGYFSDMSTLLSGLKCNLREDGEAFLIVGDSSYNGIVVDVGTILTETAVSHGYRIVSSTVLRRMRKSAQQGGAFRLGEHVLRLRLPRRRIKGVRSRASS